MTILDPVPERPTSELTRRDVARSLLSVPADEAAGALPGVRRELVAAGNPLSAPFWASAERTLAAIATGAATVGEVRRWLQATGTEPIDLFPAQGFVWPDEDERGPVAAEMHTRLVTHLEGRVADGTIDPDGLLGEAAEQWASYEQLQLTWLSTPLPDGREPMWAVVDEHDDEFLAEWDAADAEARATLTLLIAELPERPCPTADLAAACARVRAGLVGGRWPYDLLRAAGGVDPARLPADDAELWLTLAAGAVSFADEPPAALGDDAWSAWATLAHPEWLASVVTLVRSGPGAEADAGRLARYVIEFDFGDGDGEPEIAETDTDDDMTVLTDGFRPVVLLWSELGAIDADEHLTPLGWWGLPEALARAWTPTEH